MSVCLEAKQWCYPEKGGASKRAQYLCPIYALSQWFYVADLKLGDICEEMSSSNEGAEIE